MAEKLPKRVENTVGKGEIALNEQFLLFPQCFQKAYFPGASKGVIVWEWIKLFLVQLFAKKTWRYCRSHGLRAKSLTFYNISLTYY